MQSHLAATSLGVLLGVVAALSVLMSSLVAARFSRDSMVLDLVLRLATFGTLVVGVASVIGELFGQLVRSEAVFFWGAFAIALAGTPWVFGLAARKLRGGQRDG